MADAILPGYHIEELREARGEPHYREGSTDIWTTGDIPSAFCGIRLMVMNFRKYGKYVQ